MILSSRTIAPCVLVAVLAVSAGCGSSGEPSSGEQKGGPFLRCAQTRDDGGKESFKLPPLTVTRDGYDLEIRGLDRGVVVLGLLSGIHEADEATSANLAFFMEQFKAAGVQAVLVAGGVGLTKEEVDGVLAQLARAPVPVLISPGAQESLDVLRDSVKAARRKHPQLIDMTVVRRARMGQVDIISLPGYRNAFYLEAGERGCSYEPGDLSDVAALVDPARAAVLLSATPPRGEGPFSVDRGRGGVNIGDPAVTAMMKEAGFSVGLFGHVYESGGHATAGDGKTAVPQGVWQDDLLLQAGAADAVPVALQDGGISVGMAHVVEVSGHRGRYRAVPAASVKR